jgi:transcriptional regulator with XRE-family HTH domain
MKKQLNCSAKLAYFVARKQRGDSMRVAELTGYSRSHVSNVLAGRRTVPQEMANEMYNISRNRRKNSELV